MDKNTKRKMKQEIGVFKVITDGLRKKFKNFTVDKNNSHHPVYLLPDHCVPSGMSKRMGGGRVVIKDLSMCELLLESVEKDIDLIQEQLTFAIEDIYRLEEENRLLREADKQTDNYGTFSNINNKQESK